MKRCKNRISTKGNGNIALHAFFSLCVRLHGSFFYKQSLTPPPPPSAPTHKSNVVMKAGQVPKHVMLEDREGFAMQFRVQRYSKIEDCSKAFWIAFGTSSYLVCHRIT